MVRFLVLGAAVGVVAYLLVQIYLIARDFRALRDDQSSDRRVTPPPARKPLSPLSLALLEHAELDARSVQEWNHPPVCTACFTKPECEHEWKSVTTMHGAVYEYCGKCCEGPGEGRWIRMAPGRFRQASISGAPDIDEPEIVESGGRPDWI